MAKLTSCFGLVVILAIAWLLSENRRRLNLRLIASGLGLQFVLALVLLRTNFGDSFYQFAEMFFARIKSFSDAGAMMVFGQEAFSHHPLAFSVLPTIILISSMTAVLFHLGILQWIVRGMAWVMVRVMDASGTESLAAASEVFVGMTESPLVIRPYLESMTRSEIAAMMTAGMGTVAGGVMALYASWGIPAGHLAAASLMAAPASLVIAKILVPETETSLTKGKVQIDVQKTDVNVLDAACRGAADGLKLALNVAAMLIAFIGLVACVNWMLSLCEVLGGPALSLEGIFGWVFSPLAWAIGVQWDEAQTVGTLLGQKIVLNELVAYDHLRTMQDTLSDRSFTLATFALCGFANFASVAVQIGGVGGLVPARREVIARYGLRCMLGGALATLMTACFAGMLL